MEESLYWQVCDYIPNLEVVGFSSSMLDVLLDFLT